MAFEGRYRETQRGGGFGDSSSSAPNESGGVASILQGLDRDLSKFKEAIDSIGTQLDTHENRAELKRLRTVIKKTVSSIKGNLKEEKKAQAHNPQGKILVDRQMNQLESQVNRFQKLLDMEKAATKDNPHAKSSNNGVENGGSREDVISPSNQMSQMQRMGGMEVREQEAEELRQLETDILDLHDIHQEMAELVGEQGGEIDNIEKNVSQAQVRVESGTKQTTIAVQLKRKGFRLKLIIGAIVTAAILTVLLVLAILLGVFVPRAIGDN